MFHSSIKKKACSTICLHGIRGADAVAVAVWRGNSQMHRALRSADRLPVPSATCAFCGLNLARIKFRYFNFS